MGAIDSDGKRIRNTKVNSNKIDIMIDCGREKLPQHRSNDKFAPAESFHGQMYILDARAWEIEGSPMEAGKETG